MISLQLPSPLVEIRDTRVESRGLRLYLKRDDLIHAELPGFGFNTIGVIRGEEHLRLNSTLRYATNHGMRLTYMDRRTYREKTDPSVIADLRAHSEISTSSPKVEVTL
jgi:1-aminocyclopropane-1-carboxylate deaminase